jgi:hypothetical protein
MAENYLNRWGSGASDQTSPNPNYLTDADWDRREREFQEMWKTSPSAADLVYGPNMRPVEMNRLRQGWDMPEYTVAEGSGRVPMFAGPNALAPSMDRESTNYQIGGLPTLSPLIWDIPRGLYRLVEAARHSFEPTPTMQDISDLLPKQPIPDLRPESDEARAERERQYYANLGAR